MRDHSACARADQEAASIAAVRAAMDNPETVELPDEMLRRDGKRLLWRLWQSLSAEDRAAFLAWATEDAKCV
ncbi:hypothetical protein [Paracoccus jeotgali]|uniref:hypothetical protein n=1 Tax=Paracoccus jeotgali TaxID=2065379 RepID=UPI0028A86285|nr:hypothetical protein [Paracoccus jeotgali]